MIKNNQKPNLFDLVLKQLSTKLFKSYCLTLTYSNQKLSIRNELNVHAYSVKISRKTLVLFPKTQLKPLPQMK